VAPVRALGGNQTEIAGPTSVVIDRKRNELWVTNWNNHTATVFPRAASGNLAPLRVIRSAPKGSPRSGFGSPGTVAYNPKRDEILVPN
jgi:DNA-binding beta-propeller fold protein YncE